MAEDRMMMTPADIVAKAMGGEHGDLLRDAVGLVVRELMEAEVAQLTGAGAYGMVGDQFVAGDLIGPSGLRALAARPAAVPPGAKGALAVNLPGPVIAKFLSGQLNIPPALAGIALSRLGDLHGAIRATPAGLSGSFKQEIR